MAKRDRFWQKALLWVWRNFEGVIHCELVPNGRIIKADLYCAQLDWMYAALTEKCPALANRKRVLFQQDNVKRKSLWFTLILKIIVSERGYLLIQSISHSHGDYTWKLIGERARSNWEPQGITLCNPSPHTLIFRIIAISYCPILNMMVSKVIILDHIVKIKAYIFMFKWNFLFSFVSSIYFNQFENLWNYQLTFKTA